MQCKSFVRHRERIWRMYQGGGRTCWYALSSRLAETPHCCIITEKSNIKQIKGVLPAVDNWYIHPRLSLNYIRPSKIFTRVSVFNLLLRSTFKLNNKLNSTQIKSSCWIHFIPFLRLTANFYHVYYITRVKAMFTMNRKTCKRFLSCLKISVEYDKTW